MFAVALDAGLFSCLWMLEAERADAGFSFVFVSCIPICATGQRLSACRPADPAARLDWQRCQRNSELLQWRLSFCRFLLQSDCGTNACIKGEYFALGTMKLQSVVDARVCCYSNPADPASRLDMETMRTKFGATAIEVSLPVSLLNGVWRAN